MELIKYVTVILQAGRMVKLISCSHISAIPAADECSGKGSYSGGKCYCDKFYTGEKCQFKGIHRVFINNVK